MIALGQRRRRTRRQRAAYQPPSSIQRLRLTGCLVLVAAPHLFHLPGWVLAIALPLIAWQSLAAARAWPAPGRVLRFLLAASAFAIVFVGFGRVNGQEAGVSLLLIMLSLKLCEVRSHRDAMVFLSLLCFLLVTQFLFSQSLGMALYLIIGTWAIMAAFVDIGSRASIHSALTDAGRLLIQALPLAALLFVLFPRIPGPIWGLPSDAGARQTSGLSESMAPGSISELALSPGVALRARFDGPPPPPGQRYWRGPVLWDFNGRSWEINQANRRLPDARIDPASDSQRWRVDITLEATRHDWLIALDTPLSIDRPATRGAGATLHAQDTVDQRTRYIATSVVGGRLDAQLAPTSRRRALLLPSAGNPRARALADGWAGQGLSPAATVEAALGMFRQQPFVYTLSPQRTGPDNGIDEFLFDTREGFCEHFAGAFTFLMRAAGIPARVVTGYLGGEASTMGDYWIVRQADAHAWAEVWFADRGWVRVDPTAAVAPDRIESGLSGSVIDNSRLPYMARGNDGVWYQARMMWDAVDAGWNRWFLAYGPQLQQQLLNALGLKGWTRALLALTAGTLGLLALVSAWLAWRMRRRAHPDPTVRAWHRIGARLARIGYPRRPSEGPSAYAQRVGAARPDLAAQLGELADTYIRLRYQSLAGTSDAACRAFVKAARRFRPRRRPPAGHRSSEQMPHAR
ncbi:DUF3488 and DUF4129 domain-containing transglutaminase family protein [Salinisphaera sp. T31B1]|uniref:transglutaminase TgpA family protein n=1 Tax=Salinisphaera sp. T31B1 TaxID=727963 RepID=UPI0033400C64